MKFYSTNSRDHRVSLKDAVIRGLAPDNGLYMPERIPRLSHDFFVQLRDRSFADIAFDVAHALLEHDLDDEDLKRIVSHTLQFDAPLVRLDENIHALELFHGPTMAFKDFGARFMSQLIAHFAKAQEKEIVILVATSGDTGSAVANGFLGVKGTRVVVLYPSGKVSAVQEKQFTTLGQNITAVEVSGTFDDCQRLVKTAFQDDALQQQYFLTSANSINIARLIPQTFYYFRAVAQADPEQKIVVSVPSGNFGNLTAGLIAKKMGLPIERFIVSTNVNDVVPEFFHTGQFQPRASVQTISNAMDVGNPSNFARMVDLYRNDVSTLKKDVVAFAFTDNETLDTMRKVNNQHHYTLDPHGAVAYAGLQRYLEQSREPLTGIFLETAHPGKFAEVVEDALGESQPLPEPLLRFATGKKQTFTMDSSFESFRKLLKKVL